MQNEQPNPDLCTECGATEVHTLSCPLTLAHFAALAEAEAASWNPPHRYNGD